MLTLFHWLMEAISARLPEKPFVVRGPDLKVWFCLLPDFDEPLSSLNSFFSCLPVLLEKEPGWNLIFALTDCFAYRRSSLIFRSADGSGENAWGGWTNRQGCPHCLQSHLWRHHPQKLLLLQCNCVPLSLQRTDTLKFIEHSNISVYRLPTTLG